MDEEPRSLTLKRKGSETAEEFKAEHKAVRSRRSDEGAPAPRRTAIPRSRGGDDSRAERPSRFGDRSRSEARTPRGERPSRDDRPPRGERPTRVERPTRDRGERATGESRSVGRDRKSPVRGLERRGTPKLVKRKTEPKKSATKKVPAFLDDKEQKSVRLNKFIAGAGIASRRKADELISSGAVTVNGKTITELGVQVKPYEDHITVDGKTISLRQRMIYFVLNKPKDTITTTSDEKDRTTVLDYVKTHERVYPVGRLDRNTTGVLLLTNDGELTNRLTHPSYEIDREYHVTLDKSLTKDDAKRIAEGGIDIGEGDITGAAEVSVAHEDPKDVLLRLREGKNREVRRIFETLGYNVEKLDRISFAGITHRGMARGESRTLTPGEVKSIRKLVGLGDEDGRIGI